MTLTTRETELVRRLQDLESAVFQLQRPQAAAAPRFRELLDASLGDIADGQSPVYRSASGRFEPGGVSSGSSTVYNVQTYGAVLDGVADDTAALAAAYAACPAGGVIYQPFGVMLADWPTFAKMVHFKGDGRYSSWIKPISANTTGIVRFDVTIGGGSVRGEYGASFEGMGIDLTAHSTSVGLYVSDTTGWFTGYDLYMEGGAVHVHNVGTNNRFERMRLVDAGKFFKVDGDTGLELTLKDIDATRATAGTTTWGIEVISTLTSGNGGDLRLDNVVINSSASGGAVLAGGILMQAAGPVSLPVFANDVVIDNCAGPSIKLVDVKDFRFNEGWCNSAAGSTCAVEITAGTNHQFAHSTFFGGSGNGTYEFLGSTATNSFRSEGNWCPSGPVYKFTGAGGWTDAVVDDVVPGATVLAQVTNDATKFNAGLAKRWGKWAFQQTQTIPSDDVTIIGSGGGAPAFQNSWVAATSTIVYFWKDPTGVVHLSGLMTGGASGTIAVALPAGYRPFNSELFPAIGGSVTIGGGAGAGSGDVTLTGTTVGVSAITFRAAF